MANDVISFVKPGNTVHVSSITNIFGANLTAKTYDTDPQADLNNYSSGLTDRLDEYIYYVYKVSGQYYVDGNLLPLSGGGSSDADTLDGQHGSYYLNYSNFSGVAGSVSGTAFTAPSGEFTNFVAGTMYTPGNITVGGFTNVTGNSLIGATSAFTHTSRSRVYSAADGRHNLTNAATTGYSRLTWGLENANCPALKATAIGSNGSGMALVNGADTFRIDLGLRTLQHSGNYTQELNNGTVGVNTTVNWRNGNTQAITLSGSPTLTFTAPDGPARLQLVVKQDNTGGRTLTYPGTVKWPAATAPTLTTSGNATDILAFWYDGTNYYGTSALAFG